MLRLHIYVNRTIYPKYTMVSIVLHGNQTLENHLEGLESLTTQRLGQSAIVLKSGLLQVTY